MMSVLETQSARSYPAVLLLRNFASSTSSYADRRWEVVLFLRATPKTNLRTPKTSTEAQFIRKVLTPT